MTKRGNPRKPKPSGKRTIPAGPLPTAPPDPFDSGLRGMLAATQRRCSTCKFGHFPDDGPNQCRIEAPVPDMENDRLQGKATWPTGILPDDWCGDWQPM